MKWFRLYSEARTDAKLRALSAEQHRVWFHLLCFASEQDEDRGTIKGYDHDLLAVEVADGDMELLAQTLERLVKLRIVSLDGDDVTFIHWPDRQYDKPSDTPAATAARKRNQRERDRTINIEGVTPLSRDVTLSHATDTDTDTDTDTESGGNNKHSLENTQGAVRPARKRAAPKMTNETIELLVTEFGPQLQGEHKARDAITKARGFLKGKSWNPTRLREWLEGDVESLTMKQRNGNGTHTNQSGHQELTVEEYKRAWGIRT